MEMYIEQGASRQECELKIAEKYKRPFHVCRVKPVRIGGILGLFSKDGVEVEFYFSPVINKTYQTGAPVSYQVSDYYPQTPRNTAISFEEEKKKVLAAAGKDPEEILANKDAQQQIFDSLQEIKEKIDTGNRKEVHPAFTRASELLKLNDFSEKFINGMLERMRKELPLSSLDDLDAVEACLVEWIGESISIYNEQNKPRQGRVMVLVGPTGVGKTTTIAKLAAIHGIGNSKRPAIKVRMINIDAYKVGAKAQLESYGDIMEIPVSYVDNNQELRKVIALHSEDTDLFLVDTIGKSPKDSATLGEMKELLDGCGKGAEFHLVISASTKTSDIEEILRQFEPFNYRSVLLTKMDETSHIGNVISALAEKRKSVSYITDGQKVPNYIRKAAVTHFLINLDDFKIDREKIEKRFPICEADRFQWS